MIASAVMSSKISVEKLLSLMGWKADERTIELAGPKTGGDFVKGRRAKKHPPQTHPPPIRLLRQAHLPPRRRLLAEWIPFAAPAAAPRRLPLPRSIPLRQSNPA